MQTQSYSILNNTLSGTTFSTISLTPDDVLNAMQGGSVTAAALASATRAGNFSPITASAADTVAVELKDDGSAEIVVVAIIPATTTTTVTSTAQSAN